MLSRTFWLVALAITLPLATLTDAKPTKQGIRAKAGETSRKFKATNPTQTFCGAFKAQCYLSAVEQAQSTGGGAEVKVVHACRRNGGKYSKSFVFGCKADDADITQMVLDKIGGGYTITTTAISTAVASDTSTTTSTYPVTATAPTETITSETTSTEISTTYTTSTSVFLGADPVPIVIVNVPVTPASRRKRADQVDTTQFCTAFSSGCVEECARVSSTPKHTVCQAGATKDLQTQYELACYCTNGKIETQHALRDASSQENVATVSTVTTSTSFFTSAASTPTTVATITPLTTIPTTTTTTTTLSLSSTTVYVLPTTGAVQVINGPDGASLGYINKVQNGIYGTTSLASAQQFMAVRDPTSGLYSLRQADSSGDAAVVEQFNGGNLGSGSYSYAVLTPSASTSCGSASSRAGPPAGNDRRTNQACEVFVFGAQADAQTLAPPGGTLNLAMFWFNPGQSTAAQYDWDYSAGYNHLFASGDTALFAASYQSDKLRKVTFRFPIVSP